MDTQSFERLLYRGESETLDFKVDQYAFSNSRDDEQSELLKDILAFANAWRDSDAYILIGVEEIRGGKSIIRGVSNHLDDHALQQFVNGRTQRPVRFRYEALEFEGKQCGVIHIPVQERPIFLLKDFGKLKANAVAIRRGSSTDIADPDEVRRMGHSIVEIKKPLFDLHSHVRVEAYGNEFHYILPVWFFNKGSASAYEIVVDFMGSTPDARFGAGWKPRVSPYAGKRRIAFDDPLHPNDHNTLAIWKLGNAEIDPENLFRIGNGVKFNPEIHPSRYLGGDVDISLQIFARDQPSIVVGAAFPKADIQALIRRQLVPR